MRRLVAGTAASLTQTLKDAEALRAKFETQHVTNSQADYERWRQSTELIVAEQSPDWAEEFRQHPDPCTDDIATAEQLQERLEWDQARLREFAAEASGER